MLAAGQAAICSTALNAMLTWLQRTAVDTGVAAALDRGGRLRRRTRDTIPILAQKAREYLSTAQPGADADQLNQALA